MFAHLRSFGTLTVLGIAEDEATELWLSPAGLNRLKIEDTARLNLLSLPREESVPAESASVELAPVLELASSSVMAVFLYLQRPAKQPMHLKVLPSPSQNLRRELRLDVVPIARRRVKG